jgi:hypothetical protein
MSVVKIRTRTSLYVLDVVANTVTRFSETPIVGARTGAVLLQPFVESPLFDLTEPVVGRHWRYQTAVNGEPEWIETTTVQEVTTS